MTDLGVGLIGCGNVSQQYLPNGPRLDGLRFVACADVDPEAAARTAAEHDLIACTPDELLARDDVDVVLNLTPPDLHADVALQAIAAGKHVYTEKPLATSVERGREVLDAADAAGVLVGCAPDTFLGAGIQTVKTALDDGVIGTPALVQIRMLARPPESRGTRRPRSCTPISPARCSTSARTGSRPRSSSSGRCAASPRSRRARARPPRRSTGADFPIAEPTRVGAVLLHDGGVLTTLVATFDADGAARHGVEVTRQRGHARRRRSQHVRRSRDRAPGQGGRAARARVRVAPQRPRPRAAGPLPRPSATARRSARAARSACTSSRCCSRSAMLHGRDRAA